MVVGRVAMARRRMDVAEQARQENLAAVLSAVEDFLRDKASRNDLISAVVTARVSRLGADSAIGDFNRIAAEFPEEEEASW